MKYSDPNMPKETREIRNSYINDRWSQLHALAKDSGETAIKHLFTVNAGGLVAVLAYIGTVSGNESGSLPLKPSLLFFFLGLLFVGFYKTYMVHYSESLFTRYQQDVKQYYDDEVDWDTLTRSDEKRVGKNIVPYICGYLSFFFFVFGSFLGAITLGLLP